MSFISRIQREPARFAITALASALVAAVWVTGLAAVLRHLGPIEQPMVAGKLTLAALFVGALSGAAAFALTRMAALAFSALIGVSTLVLLVLSNSAPVSAGSSVVIVGLLVAALAGILAPKLPAALDEAARKRPLLAILWLLVALASIGQMGRLATYVSDQESDWHLGTTHAFWDGHMCMDGYLYAAELNERGEENIYADEHYPIFNPGFTPETRYGFADPDPYLYPPPFLLLPRLVILLSDDYQTIYAVWFAIQATALLCVAVWLAAWVGGRVGALAALLLPLTLLAFPTLFSLQYGQFHLATIVMAITAMILMDRGRLALGGFLLGFAIAAKLFPGILLIWLAGRRQWKAVLWVVAAGLVYAALGLFIVGPEAYRAFIEYALPRISSGQAFDYEATAPEVTDLVATDLQSAYGIVLKLGALGVPGMSKALGAALGKILGVALLLMTFIAARRLREGRAEHAVAWLTLLGLGSLVNAGAWGDYVPLPAVWLLTFLAATMISNRRIMIVMGIVWAFQLFIIGTMPIGEWYSLPVMATLSLIGAVLLHGLYLWVLLGMKDRSLTDLSGSERHPQQTV